MTRETNMTHPYNAKGAHTSNKAIIIAEYSDLCLCERPSLGQLANIDMEPRFEFAKAAKEWCRFNRARFGGLNKNRSAWAEVIQPCQHRERQRVRIEWTLQYN